MDSLNKSIQEYVSQLNKGQIQKAYKGIMTFMSELKAYLERKCSDYSVSSLYFGYMDMTYFAVTPSALKDWGLKIAIVFMHEECRFELWLAGKNRRIQAELIQTLSRRNIGEYKLSQVQPGVDSIIEIPIVEQPNFDNPDELKHQIEVKTMKFAEDILAMLK